MQKSNKQADPLMLYIQLVCQAYMGSDPKVQLDIKSFEINKLWNQIQRQKLHAVCYEVRNNTALCFSADLIAALENLRHKRVLQKLFLIKEIRSIQKAHQLKGIFIIPYKGIAVGELFYKNINHRDFNDIDFALEEKNIPESAKIMKALGYVENKEESDFERPRDSRSYHIDYSWVKYNDSGEIICNAEIHWQATNSALISPVEFSELELKSQNTKIISTEIRLFSKVENAYLMILHHGMVDGWFELRHLVDLVVTIKALSDEELSLLLSKLNQTKILTSLHYGVQLSRDILGAKLEMIEVPHLLKYDKYLRAVNSGLLPGKWSENKMKLFYYLLLHDNNIERIKSLLKFLKYTLREVGFKLGKNN